MRNCIDGHMVKRTHISVSKLKTKKKVTPFGPLHLCILTFLSIKNPRTLQLVGCGGPCFELITWEAEAGGSL